MEDANNVQIISDWISSSDSFRGRTDTEFISKFLNSCEHDVEKTKEKIITHYNMKKKYAIIMHNLDHLEEKCLSLFQKGYIYTDIGQPEREKPVVFLMNISRLASADELISATKYFIMVLETCVLESIRLQQYGAILIYDMGKLPMSFILSLGPSNLSLFIESAMGLPVILRKLHLINTGMALSAVVRIIKLLLPTPIKNLLEVNKGSLECLKDVPSECIPNEYGGTNGPLEENREILGKLLAKWRDYLLEEDKYGIIN